MGNITAYSNPLIKYFGYYYQFYYHDSRKSALQQWQSARAQCVYACTNRVRSYLFHIIRIVNASGYFLRMYTLITIVKLLFNIFNIYLSIYHCQDIDLGHKKCLFREIKFSYEINSIKTSLKERKIFYILTVGILFLMNI